MNPLNRFSDRAADYVKYRPTYPAAAIDKILAGLGSRSQLVAADISAGTGIPHDYWLNVELRYWL